MPKLSDVMIAALRELARGNQIAAGPTRAALLRRGLAVWSPDELGRRITVEITEAGIHALAVLDEIDREAKADAGIRAANLTPEAARELADMVELERLSRSGPAIRLTPARPGHRLHAPDSDVLQLLAMLDAGVRATRNVYREWTVSGPNLPFRLDLAKVDGAAREAIAAGLAREAFVSDHFVLTPEPVHLLNERTGATECMRHVGPNVIRLRITTDPTRVTHEGCKPADPVEVAEQTELHEIERMAE